MNIKKAYIQQLLILLCILLIPASSWGLSFVVDTDGDTVDDISVNDVGPYLGPIDTDTNNNNSIINENLNNGSYSYTTDRYFYGNEAADYIGTVSGNDNNIDDTEAIIREYLLLTGQLTHGDDFTLSGYEKGEVDDTDGSLSYETDSNYDPIGLYIDVYEYTSDDGTLHLKSGTWSTYSTGWDTTNVPQNWVNDGTGGSNIDPDPNEDLLEFYTIKGGTSYALYQVDPVSSAGTWNVENLALVGDNIKDISHFSGFISSSTGGGGGTAGQGVPEPGTMLLLGTGLLACGMVYRRKRG